MPMSLEIRSVNTSVGEGLKHWKLHTLLRETLYKMVQLFWRAVKTLKAILLLFNQ